MLVGVGYLTDRLERTAWSLDMKAVPLRFTSGSNLLLDLHIGVTRWQTLGTLLSTAK